MQRPGPKEPETPEDPEERYYEEFAELFLDALGMPGETDRIRDLIAFGQIDVNFANPKHRLPGDDASCNPTPLGCACEFRVPELVELLLELGADPNLKDNAGRSPLDNAVIGHSGRDLSGNFTELYAIITSLLAHGARSELGARNEDGDGALDFLDDYEPNAKAQVMSMLNLNNSMF